jgi:cyclopropane-fatty-acyl-phospholipid synthase
MSVADIFEAVLGDDSPVAVEAYDGSRTGPISAATTLHVRSPQALQYLVTAPNDLGMARAYVTDQLDIDGDLHAALHAIASRDFAAVSLLEKVKLFRSVGLSNLRRPPVPDQEAHLSGRRHSKQRDAAAISHHYDVSNDFYRMVLGPSMAYTCALYPTESATLEEAQAAKFDLVCRKLGLEPGMRLLDVGCGWGGMVLHAVREYGVTAVGVTLSRKQAEWGAKAVAEAGLTGRAEVRFGDYRDVRERGFDAVSSIGLTEHIGEAQLGAYFRFLRSRLREGGRLLNHCITRFDGQQNARAGGFIDRYIFPDGELEGPGRIIDEMNNGGFEIQHEENLRRHYAMTLRDWGANLDERWDEAVAEVGEAKARIWRLYLAASRVGFDLNRIQLHQVLGTVTDPAGDSGYPLRHTF